MRRKYFRYKAENLVNVKNIVTVHDFNFGTDFISEKESHDFWELVFVKSGKITFMRGEERGELCAGQILFHKPNVVHALKADGKNRSRVVIISFGSKSEALRYFEEFKGELCDKLKKYLFELVENGRKIFDISSATPETKKMPENKNPPLGGIQILKNTLELFLIYLLQTESAKSNASAVFLPPRVDEKSLYERIKSVLEANVYGRLTVNEICEKTYYSRSYLFREFKKAAGVGVMEYFGILKIKEAEKLLTATKTSVAEISAALSFDTPEYFSKKFKSVTGVTPLAYRKSAKSTNNGG